MLNFFFPPLRAQVLQSVLDAVLAANAPPAPAPGAPAPAGDPALARLVFIDRNLRWGGEGVCVCVCVCASPSG